MVVNNLENSTPTSQLRASMYTSAYGDTTPAQQKFSLISHKPSISSIKASPVTPANLSPRPNYHAESYLSISFKQVPKSFPGMEDRILMQDPQALKQHHEHLHRFSISFLLQIMHATGHTVFVELRMILCD
jgi:hypothetical protein